MSCSFLGIDPQQLRGPAIGIAGADDRPGCGRGRERTVRRRGILRLCRSRLLPEAPRTVRFDVGMEKPGPTALDAGYRAGRSVPICLARAGEGTMDNPEKVYAFLREHTPARFCDDCIRARAGIQARAAVSPIAGALGLTTDFHRARGVCSICKKQTKLVTRSLRYA